MVNPRRYNVGPPSLKALQRTYTQKLYFYLEGSLYRTLRQDHANDLLVAFRYEDRKIVHFILSEAKAKMKNAFDTSEVAKLLNRSSVSIRNYIGQGVIPDPYRIPKGGTNFYGKTFDRMKWSEDDVLALHTYLCTLGGGRPRKDGTAGKPARLPNRREVIALMRSQPMFYMSTSTGDFVPVWSAQNEV